MCVKNQRNSWHGVDFLTTATLNVKEYKRQYNRALSAVDDSLARITAWLKANKLDQNTAVILVGDNGLFGEHGLIDKRNAYEESMRVPLVAYIPGAKQNYVVEEMAANIDIAPTILDIAGIKEQKLPQFVGASLLPLAKGEVVEDWRDNLLYEYYWEFNFPHTPTTLAIRSDDYKLIQYHGVWDTDELFDLKNDPQEMNNLIDDPRYLNVKVELRKALFALFSRRW